MANFIEFKETYNPLTREGEKHKYINLDQIVSIEPLDKRLTSNYKVEGLNTRICLSTGVRLDVVESFEEIMKKEKY